MRLVCIVILGPLRSRRVRSERMTGYEGFSWCAWVLEDSYLVCAFGFWRWDMTGDEHMIGCLDV
jgi:hypothetical protein